MSIISWLGFLFSSGCAVAMIIGVAIYAKRVGGAGPWLLLTLPLFDVMVRVAFTLTSMSLRHASMGIAEMEGTYNVLRVVDLLLTSLSALLVVVAAALMRKPRLV